MQPAPEATPPANHTWRSYYHAAGRRVALRVQDGTTGADQVHYLFADHLGSSSVSYRSDGGQTVTQRYYPWGTVRSGSGNALPTGYTFTGQLDTGVGLMYYGARLYDAALARFIQPDTIVPEPGNPQALNRYSYVLNNPLRYTDPTGHCPMCISALVGAAAGAIVAYGGQVYDNLQNNNMTLAQALTTNISGREILTGAAVGGLTGLTMGAGTLLLGSGVGATLVSGAAAGWMGGRADSLAEATWVEYDRWRAGQSVEIGRLWDDAMAKGLLDPTRMVIDTGSGALSAGVGKAFGTFLQKAGLVELISTHTTSRSPVTIKGFLPNGKGVVLDFGRAPLELSLETWEQLMNAFQAGNVELAQEILSQTIDETISGTTNP